MANISHCAPKLDHPARRRMAVERRAGADMWAKINNKSKGRRFVTKTVGKIRDIPFGTFDIETQGMGGKFLDSTTYDDDNKGRRYGTVDELWSALIAMGNHHSQFIWYAHNGAGYDFSYLAVCIKDYAFSHKVTVETIQQGNKIIGLVIPVGLCRVRLYDSYPLLMSKLKDAAKAFAPECAKLPACKVHKIDNYQPSCDVCVEYMMRDGESLWFVMRNVRQLIIDTFGVSPGLTAGSTAMKAWLRTIPEGHVYYRQSEGKEAFLRKVGAGSLTYPGHDSNVWEDAITYDRNAAFASEMLEGGYPTSPGIWTNRYVRGKFGCYQVIAETPDNLPFPVIPAYTDNGRKFAVGRFEAYITSEQYEFALTLGYRFKVLRGLYFTRTEDIFSEFVGTCQDLECPPDGSKPNPAIKLIAKYMRNSLNGKFNIRPTMERIFIGEGPINDMSVRHWVDEDNGNPLPGYIRDEEVDAPYCQPVWYAITVTRQINCMARLALMLEPQECGKIDTDSITVRATAAHKLGLEIGTKYGLFKQEHHWKWIQSSAVKNYRGDEIDGTYHANVKGLPQGLMMESKRQHERAANGERVQMTFESTRTFQDTLKRGLKEPGVKRRRCISTPWSSIGWVHDEHTRQFRPIHITIDL